MNNINPNSWYRIPGYNGYEYCYRENLVRSMKAYKSNPGKILSFKDCDGMREWTLTSDADNRVRISESAIRYLIESTDIVIDGTNSINMGARRHLSRAPGYHQTRRKVAVPSEESFLPDFSELIVKED